MRIMYAVPRRVVVRVLLFCICATVAWNLLSFYWIMESRSPKQIHVYFAKVGGNIIVVGREHIMQKMTKTSSHKDNVARPRNREGNATRPKVCNNCFHTDFEYILQSDICNRNETEQNISILIFVFSKHENVNQRKALRRTWLSKAKGNITYTFVFGKSEMAELNYNVADEQRLHNDILLINFFENYRNLTLKTISAFKWAVSNCGHVNYVMKVDDDMWVNLEALQEMVTTPMGLSTNKLFGSCSKNARPFREPSHKYYVPYSMYPESTYPPYCSGTGYLTHMNLIRDIVKLSPNVPFFPLEDIYIALCLQQLGSNVHNMVPFHSYKVYPHPCLYRSSIVITSHGITANELKLIWKGNCKAQIKAWQEMGVGIIGGGIVPVKQIDIL